MKEPAIYKKEQEGVHAIYAIGVGNKQYDELQKQLLRKDFVAKSTGEFPIQTILFWKWLKEEKHLGMVMFDYSIHGFPSRTKEVFKTKEVFNIHDKPELELLQRINNIAIATPNQELTDEIFGKIVKEANFFPEYRYGNMDSYVEAALGELLKSYRSESDGWARLVEEEKGFNRFYTPGLKKDRQKEALQRNLKQLCMGDDFIKKAIED